MQESNKPSKPLQQLNKWSWKNHLWIFFSLSFPNNVRPCTKHYLAQGTEQQGAKQQRQRVVWPIKALRIVWGGCCTALWSNRTDRAQSACVRLSLKVKQEKSPSADLTALIHFHFKISLIIEFSWDSSSFTHAYTLLITVVFEHLRPAVSCETCSHRPKSQEALDLY